MARTKSILLLDFDNIYDKIGEPLVGKVSAWVNWLEDGAFEEKGRRREFVSKRVYWNTQFDLFRRPFEEAGFETFTCRAFAKSKIKAGMSSADIVLTMDAVEQARYLKDLREVIILSTDSDFVPVVNRIQSFGKRVLTAGYEKDASLGLYREHADDVIHSGALKAACNYIPEKPKWFGFRRAPVPIAEVYQPGESTSLPNAGIKAVKKKKPVGRKTAPEKQKKVPVKRKSIRAEDVKKAASIIERLGERMPDQPLGREKILKALAACHAFSKTPTKEYPAWLGGKNYAGMMRKISKASDVIEVKKISNGGVHVICRHRKAVPEQSDVPLPIPAEA